MRGLFIPDSADHEWLRYDYSQIEFRLAVHYGMGASAQRAREAYNEDPTTDFHKWVSDITGVERKPAKNINFGLVYGMGEKKLAAQLGITLEAARPIFDQYHTALPFIRELFRLASNRAEARGYVRTLLGRRRRFDLWQPRKWTAGVKGVPKAEALEKWGRDVRRAYTNKALNAVLQGGAADLNKLSMVQLWESGLCDVLGPPLMTVHDELDFSKPRGAVADEAALQAKHILENVRKLSIPLVAEMSVGGDWGACK